MNFNVIIQESVIEDKDLLKAKQKDLVLYNDDVNTFDFVSETLITVCGHDSIQAEQCTYIVHYNGKCSVKKGSYKNLIPLCLQLLDLGLSAKIE